MLSYVVEEEGGGGAQVEAVNYRLWIPSLIHGMELKTIPAPIETCVGLCLLTTPRPVGCPAAADQSPCRPPAGGGEASGPLGGGVAEEEEEGPQAFESLLKNVLRAVCWPAVPGH